MFDGTWMSIAGESVERPARWSFVHRRSGPSARGCGWTRQPVGPSGSPSSGAAYAA